MLFVKVLLLLNQCKEDAVAVVRVSDVARQRVVARKIQVDAVEIRVSDVVC